MEALSRAITKIKSIFSRSLIESVDDDGEIQIVKVSGIANEVKPDIERIQDYGLTSNPPVGGESVVLYFGGDRSDGVVIKTDSGEHRITSLNSGEVCLYSQHGQQILLNEDGEIVATNDNGSIKMLDTGVVLVGTGTGFVALSEVIDGYFGIIDTTISAVLTAVDTINGNTALMDAYEEAKDNILGSASIPSVASTNLKAD